MTTFVLVHGAWHGGWCWERLVPPLEQRGYRTITMDLPCTNGSATFETYAQTVLDAMSQIGQDDVVLVGHSLGAMTIPIVAFKREVRLLVSLCGVVPRIGGEPWDDGPPMAESGVFDTVQSQSDGSTIWPDAEAARKAFMGHCNAEDAAWAFSHLRPQNSTGLWADDYPLANLPDVPWASIACTDDVAVRPEWCRHSALRIGVDVIEIEGDHSPFISHPQSLTDLLHQLVT